MCEGFSLDMFTISDKKSNVEWTLIVILPFKCVPSDEWYDMSNMYDINQKASGHTNLRMILNFSHPPKLF